MASFFIRQKRKSWSLLKQSYKEGRSVQETVPKAAYAALGVNPAWSVEEAKIRVKSINSRNKVDRLAAASAARRQEFEASLESTFLDEREVNEFKERLVKDSFSRSERKLLSHWKTVQAIVLKLQIEPSSFASRQRELFQELRSRQLSIDYCTKLIRVFNLWGLFVSRRRGQPYEPIVLPRGHIREALAEAYLEKGTSRAGGAKPFTKAILERQRGQLLAGQWEWLWVTLFFGLRPSEVNPNWKLTVEPDGTQVLWVYQGKLTSVRKEERWKLIPLLYPEQHEALNYLKLGSYRRPWTKTLRGHFGDGYGLYSGRKGFTDLMLERGQAIEHVSAWLGHRSIERTWKHYKNRLRVQFKKPS
jgi:hypothetical protein